MDRLTKRIGNRTYFNINGKPDGCTKKEIKFCRNNSCELSITRDCPYLKMIDTLAAYEDTELEPSEIEGLKVDYWAASKEVKRLQAENQAYKTMIAEYKQSEADITKWANGAAKEGIETIKKILADQYNLTIEKIAELAKAKQALKDLEDKYNG